MEKLLSDLPLSPPAQLSPSSIETWRQCPLKFKYTRIDGLEDPSGREAVLGSFVHEVLEDLYRLERPLRTLDSAKQIASELWKTKWSIQAEVVVPPQQQRQFRWQAWWCVENLFALENPQEQDFGGLEHRFESRIGNVAVRGVIDRWQVVDDALIISDYKTGKTPAQRYRQNKFFQLLIYALALSKEFSMPVSNTQLIYLKTGDKLEYVPTQQDYDHVLERVTAVRSEVEQACETGDFPAIPSRLCDWCHFKESICPQWNPKVVA